MCNQAICNSIFQTSTRQWLFSRTNSCSCYLYASFSCRKLLISVVVVTVTIVIVVVIVWIGRCCILRTTLLIRHRLLILLMLPVVLLTIRWRRCPLLVISWIAKLRSRCNGRGSSCRVSLCRRGARYTFPGDKVSLKFNALFGSFARSIHPRNANFR